MQNEECIMKNGGSSLNFKELFAIRLRAFSIDIVRLCKLLRSDPLFWSMADQLIRSGTSIGANVIEARAASSLKDYIRFFQYSLKSANETIYWLQVISSTSDSHQIECKRLEREADEISRILASGIKTMKEKE